MFLSGVQFRASPVVSQIEPPLKTCGNDVIRIANSVNTATCPQRLKQTSTMRQPACPTRPFRRFTLLGLTKKAERIQVSDEPSAERISVIVPVLNEANRIEHALGSLIAQPDEIYEILIVDGGSTDGTQ